MASRRRLALYGLALLGLAITVVYRVGFQVPSPIVNQAQIHQNAK